MLKILKTLLAFALLSSYSLLQAGDVITEHKLWRILDQTGQQKGYLLGSGHLPIGFPHLMKVFPQLNEIFTEVTDVAIEGCLPGLAIDDCGNIEQKIKSFTFDCERGLGSLLTESELALARKKLVAVYDEDSDYIQNISCLSPFTAMDKGLQGDLILDREIARYALWHSKKVHSFEHHEFLEYIYQLPFSIQTQALQRWLRADNYHKKVMDIHEVSYHMNRIIDCYLEGDHCHILNLAKETFQLLKMEPDLQDDTGLLQHRTHRWIPHILKLLTEENKNTLFVAGLKHMYGQDNLLSLLRFRGYTIEPVILTPAVLCFSDIFAYVSEEFFWTNVRGLQTPWLLPIIWPLSTLVAVSRLLREFNRSLKKTVPAGMGHNLPAIHKR